MKRLFQQHVFHSVYAFLSMVFISWAALYLQSGSAGLFLFLSHDVIVDNNRSIFSFSFAALFFATFLAAFFLLRTPKLDSVNRIIVLNILAYSFLGFVMSILRVPFYSREVFVIGFLLSSLLLVSHYWIRHRMFPKIVGTFPGTNVDFLQSNPMYKTVSLPANSPKIDQIDILVADLNQAPTGELSRAVETAIRVGVSVYDRNQFLEETCGRIPLDQLSAAEIRSFSTPSLYANVKRFWELLLVLLSAPIVSVVMILISIVIRLDSPGPVFFLQRRTGLHGKSFTMLKFRSMTFDVEDRKRFAEHNDVRITRTGRLLRRTRLDELPQLFNVVMGHMSLIGPRPEQEQITKRLNDVIPFFQLRHSVRPGITGWAQVMAGYAASEEQARLKLEFDFFYIKNMSAWFDMLVTLKTIRTIVLGSGAR